MSNAKNRGIFDIFSALVIKACWILTVFVLFFIPFQRFLYKRFGLPQMFLYIDEIFVVLMTIFFVVVLLVKGKIKKISWIVLLPLIFIICVGLLSGIYNGNSVIVTFNGIFDYVKYFLIIPAFSVLAVSKDKFLKIYKAVFGLAVFLSVVAFLQALFFYFGKGVLGVDTKFIDIRFGIPRVPSLMGHPNLLGLYSLLFFILDFSLVRHFRWQNILLMLGVVFSASRMVWTAFFVFLILFALYTKNKKSFLLFFLCAMVFLLVFPFFYAHTVKDWSNEGTYRGYCRAKSVEIWKEHPFLGVGPGMYGGVISVKFNSKIYSEYDFSPYWFDYGLKKFHSLDQFWAQILAEMGLLGVISFLFLMVVLWNISVKASRS